MEIALTAAGVLIACFGLYWRIRTNEQRHVTARLDSIEKKIADGLERVEKKIDDHIQWHLGQGGG